MVSAREFSVVDRLGELVLNGKEQALAINAKSREDWIIGSIMNVI